MRPVQYTPYRSILLICAVAGLALFTSRIVEIPWRSALRGWDSSFYLMWVRSVVIDGDIHFANELEINNTVSESDRRFLDELPVTATGHIPNKFGIGWGLLSLPFFLAADWLVLGLRAIGLSTLERDGYNFIYQVFLMGGHLFYALAGLYYATRFVGFFFDRWISLAAVITTWGCSMLLYYQTIRLGMTHNVVFMLVAFATYHAVILYREPDRGHWPRVTAILTAGALLSVTRYPSIVYMIFPAFVLARYVWLERSRAVWQIATALPLATIPVLLQLVAWKIIYGQFLLNTYSEAGEGFNWGSPKLLEVLFSPRHGLFYWHPFLLLSSVGLVLWLREAKPIYWLLTVPVVLTLYINASWWSWWFGAAFGARSFEATVLFLMLGTAFLFARTRDSVRAEKGLLLALHLFLLFNIYLAVIYSLGLIDRQGPVTWIDMVRAPFLQ